MRAVVQRVTRARVSPGGEIGAGLCVLLGVARGDTASDAVRLAGKVARLRIFQNREGKFDRSLLDTGCAALVVSPVHAACRHGEGNRPTSRCSAGREAEPIYEASAALRAAGVQVETGVFGARMEVELVNDGPVTIILES